MTPERVTAVRRTGSARRWSSGRILRAAFTLGPAMWEWMSTPPGITSMPRASIVRAVPSRADSSTIRPSRTAIVRVAPSSPLAGS